MMPDLRRKLTQNERLVVNQVMPQSQSRENHQMLGRGPGKIFFQKKFKQLHLFSFINSTP
jgi:hypothetical protein